MKVLLNEAGYVESYALEGELLEAVECDPPEDITVFETHFAAFRIRDGTLVMDKEQLDSMHEAETLNGYRQQREKDCFPIINRGELWMVDHQLSPLKLLPNTPANIFTGIPRSCR